MPTSTDITNLKINTLTEAQYDTAVQGGVIGANELSIITDLDDAIQVDTLPTASATEEGKIYQFIGTTTVSYTNGYFYKCVSDGAVTPTYSWTQTNVQPAGGGSSLPSQTGNAGKFLTTDGTDASWGTTVDENVLDIKNTASGLYSDQLQMRLYAPYNNTDGTPVEIYANHSGICTISGVSLSLGSIRTTSTGKDIGSLGYPFRRIYVNNIFNGADIAVPTVEGSMSVQVSSMPTASSTLEGQIYQFTGATDSTYTNGRFYKCVSDGQNPATYSWTEVQLGGGGSSYTAGTGIDITGGVISVTSPTVRNYTTASNSLQIATTTPSAVAISTGSFSTAVGEGSYVKSNNGIAIGRSAFVGTDAGASIVIGNSSSARSNDKGAILIGGGSATTQGSGTFSISLSTTGLVGDWHTYKVLDSDGTVPTARLTKVNTTITLTAAGWSSNTQTVNVTGMTATGVVMVSPDPTDQADYTSAGIICSAQAAGTLTFTCSTTPANDIDVVVVML